MLGIVGCFWDINAGGATVSNGGTGRTTAEMQTMTTFMNGGWDFEGIWMICKGEDYPHLQWEGLDCADE